MIVEQHPVPFLSWLAQAAGLFLLLAVGLSLFGIFVGFLVAAVRYGPMAAGDMTYRVVRTGLGELVRVSPRRVWALAYLAVKESLRRRVMVALLVFVVILMFAGWFLGQTATEPVKLYVSFVITATSYLVLAMALFMGVFSLPNDIKSRTIFTVVTKPVYAGELVLGRILGFAIVGTVMLSIMGAIGYVFVVRSLTHSHDVDLASLKSRADGDILVGKTTLDMGHTHEVLIRGDGTGYTDVQRGHWHKITSRKNGDRTDYTLGPPIDQFRARVPVYGGLRFLDRKGQQAAKGISVGNEWTYRSYIAGQTQAAAIWKFTDVTPERFGDRLPIELGLSVFRTHKGTIDQGIAGSIMLRNPRTGARSEHRNFVAKEYSIDQQFVPREQFAPDGKVLDLYDDLVDKEDGNSLEVWVRCTDPGQYFGMAKADCYLRAAEGSFQMNFIKGYLGVWVQMVLVLCIGVLYSTFLSGPVAMVATLGTIILGFCSDFIIGVGLGIRGVKAVKGGIEGGGPLEALIRLLTQMNVTLDFEAGAGTTAVQSIDRVLMFFVESFIRLMPDFRAYDTANWVASGYSIPTNIVVQNLLVCVAYFIGVYVAGYFFLRIREVAK